MPSITNHRWTAIGCVLAALLLAAPASFVHSIELTFELVDSGKECFYEEIKKNETVKLEFQVSARSSKPAA